MNIASLSIQRPVLATVISIVLVLFGIIGFTFLGVREYPSVDPPVVTVSTSYIGANADVIESQITEPLEESINGVAGIRSLSSVSRDGRSVITVEFELGMDMEAAANDVRDRVSRAIRNLPPDTDPPIVTKSDADASPIVALTVQSNSRDLMDEYMMELIRLTDTIPEKHALLVVTSPGFSSTGSVNSGFMRVALVQPEERERSQQEIVDMLSGLVRKYNFARTYVVQEQTIGGTRGFGLPVQFVILAPNFEKLRESLIIMFTVPLALAGALLSLWMFGQTINIFSQIGVIVLIGIVTKNGILIVEFANQRKAAGLSLHEAVIDAATRRLRPILMTSLATALGALPIAIALGAASKSRMPMGITIIGGLIFSLMLTLYVIPSLYTYLSRKTNNTAVKSSEK